MKGVHPQELELKHILTSEAFRDKETYQRLLAYLVESYFAGKTPKEVTLAHEFFQKGKDFNATEDTSVRVHMHKLRKLLAKYYETEGRNDKIRLRIPEGHYQVAFEKQKPSSVSQKSTKHHLLQSIVILLALLVIALGVDKWVIHRDIIKTIDRGDAIWKSFFSNTYRTSIVIGDFLAFHEWDELTKQSRRIQDYTINTTDELHKYSQKHPDRYVEKWVLGELPHNSIFNLVSIQPVFYSFKRSFDIVFTTEIDINYITNRNLIYIGEFKNLRALADLTNILPIRFETLPWWQGTVSYTEGDTMKTLKTYHDWNVSRYVIDLGMVAKLPGPNNENYLIFAGIGYNAQIKMVQLFSESEALESLEAQILKSQTHIPEYFAIVFEVTGFDRASTDAEMKYFHEVTKNDIKNYY